LWSFESIWLIDFGAQPSKTKKQEQKNTSKKKEKVVKIKKQMEKRISLTEILSRLSMISGGPSGNFGPPASDDLAVRSK